MTKKEIKIGLWQLSKADLVKIFPSLDLKTADKKDVLIEAILSAVPTDQEIADLKEILDKKKSDLELEPKPVYIVVHAINEDGKIYNPGGEYSGKCAEKFLKSGLIKKG